MSMREHFKLKKNHRDMLSEQQPCPVGGCKFKPTFYASSLARHVATIHQDVDKDMALYGVVPDRLLDSFMAGTDKSQGCGNLWLGEGYACYFGYIYITRKKLFWAIFEFLA